MKSKLAVYLPFLVRQCSSIKTSIMVKASFALFATMLTQLREDGKLPIPGQHK